MLKTKQINRFPLAKTGNLAFLFLLLFGFQVVWAEDVYYIIKNSGTTYDLKKNDNIKNEKTGVTLTSVISNIESSCGNQCSVQFEQLDIGTATITFASSSSRTITLLGKITSNSGVSGVIKNNGISLDSKAVVINTSATSTGIAIIINNAGSLSITDGQITADSYAIQSNNNNTINLSNSPNITGKIKAKSLSVDDNFNPEDRIYNIEFASPTVGATAVQHGKNYRSNFTILNSGIYFEVSGNDLLISNKQDGADVEPPTESTKTHNSITINSVTASTGQVVEYAISENETNEEFDWQTGLNFTGLESNATYYIFARSKGNNDYRAGEVSEPLEVKTNTDPTLEPSSSSAEQSSSSEEPELLSSSSSEEAEQPSSTSEGPSSASVEPSSTSEEPSSASVEPSSTSEDPSSASVEQSSSSEAPSSSSTEAVAGSDPSSSSTGTTPSSSSAAEEVEPSSSSAPDPNIGNPTPIISNWVHPSIGNIGVQTTANSIVLTNLPANAKVEVYNLSGKRIHSVRALLATPQQVQVQKGMYIVKVGSKTFRVVVR